MANGGFVLRAGELEVVMEQWPSDTHQTHLDLDFERYAGLWYRIPGFI